MAYTLTYDALVHELQQIVDDTNDEFIENIPRIIARGQDAVQRDLGLSIWRRFEISSFTAGVNTYPRQPSWMQVLSMNMPVVGGFIEQRHLDWIRAFGGTSRGQPRYWAEVDEGMLRVAPTPLMNTTVEVEYLQKLPTLSSTNQTNWISQNAADLLLLASLIGCEAFLVGAERAGQFMQLYQAILQSAQNELRGSERSRYAPIRAAAKPTMTPGATA